MIVIIFLVFAFVLVLLAAVNIEPQRVSLGWLGLAFYFLSLLLGHWVR